MDDLLTESINDKGIFKAVFFAGLPGAGKSYTINKISGSINPRIVNTDTWYPFFKMHWEDEIFWTDENNKALMLVKEQLFHYINGCLPLIIDSTSGSQSRLIRRQGILESLGYDTMMVWINTDISTALKNVQNRKERSIPIDFIEKVDSELKDMKAYYKSKFHIFMEVENTDNKLNNIDILNIYKKSASFFNRKISNPLGVRYLEKMKENKWKYLTDGIFSIKGIKDSIYSWYLK